MSSVGSLSPRIQEIETAFSRLAVIKNPNDRRQQLLELVNLLRFRIATFTEEPAGTYQLHDWAYMEVLRTALVVDESPELDRLRDKVTRLTTQLYAFSQHQAYLASVINEGRFRISLDELPQLLAQCGPHVRRLDFSLLLAPEDSFRLSNYSLETLLSQCPELESLTFVGLLDLSDLKQVLQRTRAALTLKNLTLACCPRIRDPLVAGNELTPVCKKVTSIGYVSPEDSRVMSRLYPYRISANLFCSLPTEHQDLLRSPWHEYEFRSLFSRGLRWSTFQQAPPDKISKLLKQEHLVREWTNHRSFDFDVLLQLENSAMDNLLHHSYEVDHLLKVGMDFAQFCRLSEDKQRQFLSSWALRYYLSQGMSLSQFLDLPQELKALMLNNYSQIREVIDQGLTLPEFLQLSDDQRALLLANSQLFYWFKQKGITPQKFLTLEITLLKSVMERAGTILELLSVGMDIDAFCALDEATRKRVLASPPMAVLLFRGENLQTVLSLSEDELLRISKDPSGFSCNQRLAVPKALMEAFSQAKPDDLASMHSLMVIALVLAKREFDVFTVSFMLHISPHAAAVAGKALVTCQNDDDLHQTSMQTIVNGGIPLTRFVELPEPVRGWVLKRSKQIGKQIRQGMNFEDILKRAQVARNRGG